MEGNEDKIGETDKNVEKVREEVKKVEESVENLKEKVEATLYEEIREREAKKKSLIIHGLEEPAGRIKENKERMEDDMKACMRVLRETCNNLAREDVKYCRRIGERNADNTKTRPLAVGLKREADKEYILERARRLKNTKFEYISIVADLTKKQRQEEMGMEREAEKRNGTLSTEDKAKNLKWIVVGRKGEKRIIKTIPRVEEDRGRGSGQVSQEVRGDKRGRETESEDEMEQDKRQKN